MSYACTVPSCPWSFDKEDMIEVQKGHVICPLCYEKAKEED